MTSVPGRRNGFSSPYSKPQILAWLVLLVTALQFLFFCSPVLPPAASIPATIFFFVLVAGIIYYGGLTQAIDPMDPHLRRFLYQKQPESEAPARLPPFYNLCNPPLPSDTANGNGTDGEAPPPLPPPLPEEPMKHCWLCETAVSEHSMHCKFCNKCVRNFDHHCMWLNTCIGSDNYQYFFRTMAIIFVMQLCHMAVQIGLAVDLKLGGSTEQRAAAWFNASAPEALFGVWIGYSALEAASVFLIGQLLWFHVRLQREQLTTYAYIVRESAKKREQQVLEREIDAYRTGAIAKANHEGHKVDAGLLHLGRWCRAAGCTACDPLAFPQRHHKPPGSADEESGGAGGFANALSSSSNNSPPDISRTNTLHQGDSNASDDNPGGEKAAEEAEAAPHGGGEVTFVKVASAAASSGAPKPSAAAVADESESSSPSELNESQQGQPNRFPSVRKAVST